MVSPIEKASVAERVEPELRAQIERAMADPTRMMPHERAILEQLGFVTNTNVNADYNSLLDEPGA